MILVLLVATPPTLHASTITVGSKNFNEGYILSEILAQLLEAKGYTVDRKFGLGGTLVCYEALKNGGIDVYPEYSGTLGRAILKLENEATFTELQRLMAETTEVELLDSFGFNNTYAIALAKRRARELGVETISDLKNHPELRLTFSHEFINRNDGWPGLAEAYGLPHRPAGIEHGLAYQAIKEGKIDVTDVYSTDGDIRKFDLVLMRDDRGYFPIYLAAPLVRADLDDGVKQILLGLAGTIDAEGMRRLNAGVVLEGKTFAQVALAFLGTAGMVESRSEPGREARWRILAARTGTHLKLTFIALLAAMLIAMPAGVVVYRARRISRPVIYFAGTLQTIPSIALLAIMIPLFGIGATPAIIALFLYALLPILRNTATALQSVDPVLKRVATGMGLTTWQRLRRVELPLAAPTILAGIRTAAVINIGTATLAAFIGAGGLGEPIVTGLALGDTSLILEGAIPAAILAILTELGFEGLERGLIPRHLLQSTD